MCAILGFRSDELLQRSLADFAHPDDLEADLLQARDLAAGRIDAYQLQRRCLTAAGLELWVLQSASLVRDSAGAPRHAIIQLQDVSERRELEERLRHRADHDALTGVWNRGRFEGDVNRSLTAPCTARRRRAATARCSTRHPAVRA